MAVQNKLLMAGRRTIAGLASAMIVIMASLEAARANLDDLQLQGMGTLRWMGLKIYEARLFASKRPNPAQLTQLPFALELTYARDFNGSSIAERSIDEIKKLGIGSTEQHQAWRSRMQAIFPNVKSGDRIRGIHRPGSGASFMLNDKPIGNIDDAEFARAFFAIWLDPKTSEPSLRKELLGLNASQRP
jgi:hypothetical protein